MNTRNPKFWALIGFGVGAVIASAGTFVHPLDSLFGGLIQAAIWFVIKRKSIKTTVAAKPSTDASFKSDISTGEYVQAKFCDECQDRVPLDFRKCFKCEGTKFTHKKVPVGDLITLDSPNLLPEFKSCPMCAEQIKYAAKKCRYCQHLMTE
jgi:ribosomal protein L40E